VAASYGVKTSQLFYFFYFYFRRFIMTNFNANTNTNNTNTNSKSGNGVSMHTMLDCRIAGPGNYHPAHRKQGAAKDTQAQINFTVYQNKYGRKNAFPVTAWGKMADILAKGGATGKQLHLICSAHSYRGRVWYPVADGQQPQCVMLADGTPLLIEKIGYTVEELVFGVDSAKTIQEELQSGFRPAGWNDPATPGYQEWRNRCAANNAIVFDPNVHTQQFGYARVKPVNGTIVVSGGNQSSQPQYNQAPAPQQYQQNNQAVQNGFNQGGQQAPAPQQNQPVHVGNQYVGQAMPQQNAGHAPQPQAPANQQFQGYQTPAQNGGGVVM
jgi:hypothetical protein